MNLWLDPRNGHLRLPNGHYIHPALLPYEITTLGASQLPSHRDMNTGWHWYNLQFNNAPYSISVNLGFLQKQLRTYVFGWSTGVLPKSWDAWDERVELQQAKELENWLSQQVGRERTFGWGTAWAGYDPRSASSTIVIHYALP